MLRSRNFLIGLGTGLVLSSLFLLTLSTEEQTPTIPKELTLNEIREAASTFGYQLYTKEEIDRIKQQPSVTQTEQTRPSKDVLFTIQKGMSTKEIAELLVKEKIIQNKEEFLQIIEQYNLVKEIRANEYTYSSSMSIEDLIAMITNTKKENWEKSS